MPDVAPALLATKSPSTIPAAGRSAKASVARKRRRRKGSALEERNPAAQSGERAAEARNALGRLTPARVASRRRVAHNLWPVKSNPASIGRRGAGREYPQPISGFHVQDAGHAGAQGLMPNEGERSFEELAVPHLETVYRIARRLAGGEHDAEDLVQETYLKAYRAFERFEIREYGIKPWLLKILHNTYLNRVARQKRGPKAVDQQTLDQVQADAARHAPPDLDYENVDEEVKRAIDALPTVLLMWATMELSYQDIADVLSIPIGTVMSRLHRARQNLARELESFAREQRIGGPPRTA